MAPDLTVYRMGLALAATVVYVAVGVVVGRRQVSRESLVANRSFQAWWFGLAVITLFNPLMVFLDGLETQTGKSYFSFRLLLFQFILVGIILAIGCLVYYLLYVYSGRTGVFWPVAAYHLVILAWLMFLIANAHPQDYGPHCPQQSWCYEKEFAGTPAARWIGLSIILPIVLSAVAYFALFFRVEGRAQRYRIAMVGGALLFWFGSSLVAQFIRGNFENANGVVTDITLNQWVYWSQIISPTISVLSALAILLAYRPPSFIRQSLEPSGG